MKKKVLAMLMASAMVFSLTACGGNAETVVEETQQEEIVEDSSTKEETKQEETVVETSPKEEVVEETQEVEKVEEPEEGIAPVQPTSRIAHISQGGISGDVTETLEYNADGSYTVKGRFDSQEYGSSYDYEFRYNNKGEAIYIKNAYYSESTPNGLVNEIDLIQGYPVSATTNETVEPYGYTFRTNSGFILSDGNYVDNGYTLVDSGGNFLGSFMPNGSYIMYMSPLGMFKFGKCDFPKLSLKVNADESRGNLSLSVDGNKTFITGSYTEEAYDAEQRKNVNKEMHSFVDIIMYGDNGLVDSIETYMAPLGGGDFSPENVENGKLAGYAHYKYDSQGNVLECKAREADGSTEIVVTYDYGNGTQTVSDSEDTTSDSSAANNMDASGEGLSSEIVGEWKDTTGLNDVSFTFNADGTGYEMIGGKIDFTYTVDGNIVTISSQYGDDAYEYVDGWLKSGDLKITKVN